MSDRPAITGIAPWVGSNAGMLNQILPEIGAPRAYWEVFLGGGSVLLAKKPSQKETVVDLHPEIINLVAVLASHRWQELDARLACTVFSDTILAACVAWHEDTQLEAPATPFEVSDEQLEGAYATFVKWWMGRGGTAGGPQEGTPSLRFNSTGGSMPSRFRSACAALVWLHQRLERVGFYNRDTFTVLPKIEDREGTVIYADPTFIGKEGLYTHGLTSKPDDAGLVEDDHDRLAALLTRFEKTRVVLRYYKHPRLDDLYKGWRVIDCARTKHSATPSLTLRSVGTTAIADDILLINGPPLSERLM